MIHSGELQEETDGLRTYEASTLTSPLRKNRYFVNLQECLNFVYIYVTLNLTILIITLM